MKNTLRSLFGCGLLCASAFQLAAQQLVEPPKVLQIYREDIKQGKDAAHEKVETKFAQSMAKFQYPTNILAMVAVSGPSQAWFLESHDTFASIGDTQAFFEKPANKVEFDPLFAQDGDLRANSQVWLAVYRPDLSYHGAQLATGLPKCRYFNVTIYHVRQDHDQEFAELAKMAVTAAEKALGELPAVAYQVVSGTNAGTYIVFQAMASLQTLDEGPARSQALFQAMGNQAGRFIKQAADTIASEQTYLFAINPKMSYVSKEFASVDPDFWTPKKPEGKAKK